MSNFPDSSWGTLGWGGGDDWYITPHELEPRWVDGKFSAAPSESGEILLSLTRNGFFTRQLDSFQLGLDWDLSEALSSTYCTHAYS